LYHNAVRAVRFWEILCRKKSANGKALVCMRQSRALNHSPFAGIKKTERMLRQSSADSDITVSLPAAGSVGRHTESVTGNLTRGDLAVKVAESKVLYAASYN